SLLTAQVRGRRVGDVRFDGLFGRRLGYLAGALIQRAFCPPKPVEVKALQEPDALVSKRSKPRAPALDPPPVPTANPKPDPSRALCARTAAPQTIEGKARTRRSAGCHLPPADGLA